MKRPFQWYIIVCIFFLKWLRNWPKKSRGRINIAQKSISGVLLRTGFDRFKKNKWRQNCVSLKAKMPLRTVVLLLSTSLSISSKYSLFVLVKIWHINFISSMYWSFQGHFNGFPTCRFFSIFACDNAFSNPFRRPQETKCCSQFFLASHNSATTSNNYCSSRLWKLWSL